MILHLNLINFMSDYNTIIKLEMLIDKNIKFCKFDLDGKI